MNNFTRNPFGNNNMNQTRIVSKYNQVSKDGGRVSTEEVRKNMQQLKGNDVRLTVFPNQQNVPIDNEQPTVNNQQSSMPKTPQSLNPQSQNFNTSNSNTQMKMARDRINGFRNIGRN